MIPSRYYRLFDLLTTPQKQRKFFAYIGTRTGPRHAYQEDIARGWSTYYIQFQKQAKEVFEKHQMPWDSKHLMSGLVAWHAVRPDRRTAFQHEIIMVWDNIAEAFCTYLIVEASERTPPARWDNLQINRELYDLNRYLEDFLINEHIASRPLLRKLLIADMLDNADANHLLPDIQRALEQDAALPADSVIELHHQVVARKWGLLYHRVKGDIPPSEAFNAVTRSLAQATLVDTLLHLSDIVSWQRKHGTAIQNLPFAQEVITIARQSEDPDIKLALLMLTVVENHKPTLSMLQAWRTDFEALIQQQALPFLQEQFFRHLQNATTRYRNAHIIPESNQLLWETTALGIQRGWSQVQGKLLPGAWAGIIRLAALVIPETDFREWMQQHTVRGMLPDGSAEALISALYAWKKIAANPYAEATTMDEWVHRLKQTINVRAEDPLTDIYFQVLNLKMLMAEELQDTLPEDRNNLKRKINTIHDNIRKDDTIHPDTRQPILRELTFLLRIIREREPQKAEALRNEIRSAPNFPDAEWFIYLLESTSTQFRDAAPR